MVLLIDHLRAPCSRPWTLPTNTAAEGAGEPSPAVWMCGGYRRTRRLRRRGRGRLPAQHHGGRGRVVDLLEAGHRRVGVAPQVPELEREVLVHGGLRSD